MFDSAKFLNTKCVGVTVFLHALFMLQAMAALASSKEADWKVAWKLEETVIGI